MDVIELAIFSWRFKDTEKFLVTWNRVNTQFNTKKVVLMNIFNKADQKLLKQISWDAPSMNDFRLTCTFTADKKGLIVLEGRLTLNETTGQYDPESRLHIIRLDTKKEFHMQLIQVIPGYIYQYIFAQEKDLVMISEDVFGETERRVLRWNAQTNSAPIGFIREIQKMAKNGRVKRYKQKYGNCFIFPEMVNYTHIYA